MAGVVEGTAAKALLDLSPCFFRFLSAWLYQDLVQPS